ncbi:unnamed protein product [Alternaria alternata]|nr:hypothetical protein AALT_g2910 [Alternaria alternata]
MAVKPITGVSASLPAMAGGTVRKSSTGDATALPTAKIASVPVLTFQGYHVPAVRHRDAFYQKLEDERASALGQK